MLLSYTYVVKTAPYIASITSLLSLLAVFMTAVLLRPRTYILSMESVIHRTGFINYYRCISCKLLSMPLGADTYTTSSTKSISINQLYAGMHLD